MALAIIFGMLFLMFGDLRYAVAVFAGVPFALIGGVLSLLLRGLPFSIPAAVGFIAVAGRRGAQRRRHGQRGAAPARGAATGATALRSRARSRCCARCSPPRWSPPSASSRWRISTRAGAEVQRPLATVVIGGILSSTVLSLLVLPVLLDLLVVRRSRPQESEQRGGSAVRGVPPVPPEAEPAPG